MSYLLYCDLRWVQGPVMMISDSFSAVEFEDDSLGQVFMSVKQFVRVRRMVGVMIFLEI